MAIVGWDGTSASQVRARRSMAFDILRRHGAASLGRGAGESWLRHRFEGPYLRDTLMDQGYLVETLETATSWARLAELRESVTGALTESLGHSYVMAHVSHVYETGASLYITALASAGPDQAERWRAAKQAASEVIVAHGATITHHHGIGSRPRALARGRGRAGGRGPAAHGQGAPRSRRGSSTRGCCCLRASSVGGADRARAAGRARTGGAMHG